MGIQLQWDNPERTIIRYDFDSHWTSEDFFNAIAADDPMIASVDHPVHLIFDMSNSDTVPVIQLTRLRQIANSVQDNSGMIVLVGANMWINALADIFQKVYATRLDNFKGLFHTVTLEDARTIIAGHEAQMRRTA